MWFITITLKQGILGLLKRSCWQRALLADVGLRPLPPYVPRFKRLHTTNRRAEERNARHPPGAATNYDNSFW
jgi:hypothetical protein